jgi:hypothetical protein
MPAEFIDAYGGESSKKQRFPKGGQTAVSQPENKKFAQ